MAFPVTPKIVASSYALVVPTISTSAYTAGDQIGGVMTLSDVVRPFGNHPGTAWLQSISVFNKANVAPVLDFLIFNIDPTDALSSVDNGAFNLSGEATIKPIQAVQVGNTWSQNTTGTNANSLDGGGLAKFVYSTTPHLYAVAIIRSAVTFASTSDLQIIFGFLPD